MFSKHTRGARRYRSVTDPAAAGSAAGSVAGSVARKRKKNHNNKAAATKASAPGQTERPRSI